MPKPLSKYQAMRDFQVTPEPKGAPRPRKQKLPIFVIQKHAASHLHYDFRLEIEGVLKSWAVPKGPSYDPATKRLAMMTEDHPYEYASFEGVIPEGNYGAGNVIIWDHGTWEFIGEEKDAAAAVRKGEIKFRIDGVKMKGEWVLIHLRGRSRKENEWLLVKHRDAWASSSIDVTEVAPQSVVSGKLVEEVGGKNVWISNRKATRVRTFADRVRSKAPAKRKPAAAGPPPATKAAVKRTATKRAAAALPATAKRAGAKTASARKKAAKKR